MPSLYRKIRSLIDRQFFWSLDYAYVARRQLFGAIGRTKPDHYQNPKSTKPSVILIPGIYERWQFMKPVASLLHRYGYDVHVIEGLGYNRRSVEDMARIVHVYIHTNDIKRCILLAHSKGGLIGKYVLTDYNVDQKVKGMIALNTPFSGSKYAYLFLLIKSLRIFIPNSSILKLLSGNQSVNASIVSIYSKFDPHIPDGSNLAGAKNIQLDSQGHFRVMNDPLFHQAILDELKNLDTNSTR